MAGDRRFQAPCLSHLVHATVRTAVCAATSPRVIDPEVAIASSQRYGPVDLNPIEVAVSKRKSPLADSGNGLTITRGSAYTT
jgi:hypothetical protein